MITTPNALREELAFRLMGWEVGLTHADAIVFADTMIATMIAGTELDPIGPPPEYRNLLRHWLIDTFMVRREVAEAAVADFKPEVVQAGTVMPDMSMTTGRMGQDHGYLRGSYGSVTPDMTTDNFEIRRLTVRNNTGLVTFRVEGLHPQDDFTSLEIVSIGTVLTAAAASYNFDGTDSIWTWATGFALVDTTVYAVEFV